MQDTRIRIRISLNPENKDDLRIIEFLNGANENAQMLFKKCVLYYINADDKTNKKDTKVSVNLLKEEVNNKEKRKTKFLCRKTKKDNKSIEDASIIKYKVEEINLDGYESLEKYVIEKKLEPDVMNMMAMAIDCGIDYKLILSMVENNLSANQMRAVIDLIMAKKPSLNNTPIIKSANNNKSNKENKKNVKENDPLAVELKGVPDDIDDK